MKKYILIIALVLLSACSIENKEALACIEKNTCNLNSENNWEKIENDIYTLRIEGVNNDYNIITFNFNEKTVKNEVYVNNQITEYYLYDWNNDIGYKYYDGDDVYAVDGETHMKIVEKTTHIDDKLKSSLVWDDINSAVISPFRNTPLYPVDLE